MSCRTQSSRSRSLDVSDRADISLLAPQVIISNGPDYNHAKDQKRPVEVGDVGVRCNGKEHEDPEHGLEGHGPAAMDRQVSLYSGTLRCLERLLTSGC
jgi:hypothetical protein